MQLTNTKIGSVIQGGITESTNFTIEADGTMFRLLSDTLYQNKIGSMIREVSCNAVDAHIVAGKPDVPFVIHAPTAMEPWFSVIDQGIGLSHDDVVNIFTCFGKSTKRTSNTMVGAFGFGSKTPFAYTNAFTVISIKDGVKNSYSAVVGEDGLPAMNLMGTEETTEGNGVEITVAVETYDFREFYAEIANQLRHFKVKPIVTGKDITFPNPYENVIEQIDNHTFFRKSSHGGSIEVVQGGIAYPVDLSQLQKGNDDEALRNFVQSAVSFFSPIFIFDIGQIAVTPSRESISYDAATIKNILDRLRAVRETLVQRITVKMDETKSPWNRVITLNENRNLYSKIIDFKNNPWNVETYGNEAYISLPADFSHYIEDSNGRTQHFLTKFSPNETNNGKFRLTTVNASKIVPETEIAIIVDDNSGYGHSRIRRYVEETGKSVYFLTANHQNARTFIRKLDDGTIESRRHYDGGWVQGKIDPVVFTRFTDAVEGATIIFLADLPKQERVYVIKNDDGTETAREKYTPAKAYKFMGFHHERSFGHFKNYEKIFVAPKKMTEKAAYVLVDNRTIATGLTYELDTFLKIVYRAGVFTLPIYAIREIDVKKIADNPNWIPLADAVKNLRAELEAKYKPIHLREALRYSGEGIVMLGNQAGMSHFAANKDKIEDGLFRGMVTRWNRYIKRQKTNCDEICQHLYADSMAKIRERQKTKDKKRNAVIMKRYPILDGLNHGYYNIATEPALNQYIDVINLLYKN